MKKQFIPMAVIFVVAMFAVSTLIGNKDIIFPEISALTLGAWVMEKSPWDNKALNLWLSPTLAALTGVLITRFLPGTTFFLVIGAFILVALQLILTGSGVLPALSAAILPIITNNSSWFYPLSVCIMTILVAGGRKLLAGTFRDVDSKVVNKQKLNELPNNLAYWLKLLIGVILVSGIALLFHMTYMIAPPLIVAFAEFSKPNSPLIKKAWLTLVLLVIAAVSGVLFLYFIYYLFNWPLWLSTGLSLSLIFLLFYYLRFPFPPAAAIALLPTILPPQSLWLYPWEVLIGGTLFLLISYLTQKEGVS